MPQAAPLFVFRSRDRSSQKIGPPQIEFRSTTGPQSVHRRVDPTNPPNRPIESWAREEKEKIKNKKSSVIASSDGLSLPDSSCSLNLAIASLGRTGHSHCLYPSGDAKVQPLPFAPFLGSSYGTECSSRLPGSLSFARNSASSSDLTPLHSVRPRSLTLKVSVELKFRTRTDF